MQIEHHILDIVCRPAVVVNDGDAADGFQQLQRLHLVGTVGVHHHQQTVTVGPEQRFLAGDKTVLVFRNLLELFNQAHRHIVLQIHHDIGMFALFAADTLHADRRADGIQIGVFMPHDEDGAGFADELCE